MAAHLIDPPDARSIAGALRDAMDIQLTLTLDEVNAVLAAVGTQPYNQVAGLIDRIRMQATQAVLALQASTISGTATEEQET